MAPEPSHEEQHSPPVPDGTAISEGGQDDGVDGSAAVGAFAAGGEEGGGGVGIDSCDLDI